MLNLYLGQIRHHHLPIGWKSESREGGEGESLHGSARNGAMA